MTAFGAKRTSLHVVTTDLQPQWNRHASMRISSFPSRGFSNFRILDALCGAQFIRLSNWPFPGENPTPRIGEILNALSVAAQSQATLHRILVENPETLYGFDPVHRPAATG